LKKKDNVILLFASFLSPWQQVSFSIKVIQDHLKLKSRQQPSAQKGKYWHGFRQEKDCTISSLQPVTYKDVENRSQNTPT